MNPRKVVLVTAASKGIGRAIAQKLSGEWDVVLLARSASIVDQAAELQGLGVAGSLTVPADLERFVRAALDRYGRIDALVNNTGHPPRGELLTLTDEQWLEGFNLILLSVIRLTRLVMPVMLTQKAGTIVTISSFTARQPGVSRPVSSVLRAGLSSLTRLHAEHGARDGVQVNSVMPGFVDSYPVTPADLARIPAGRIATVEELATFVQFLLSPGAAYITGQNLLFDGGLVPAL